MFHHTHKTEGTVLSLNKKEQGGNQGKSKELATNMAQKKLTPYVSRENRFGTTSSKGRFKDLGEKKGVWGRHVGGKDA